MFDLFAKSKLNLKLIVAHMNHGIREEAIEDEQFVKALAKNYGFGYKSKVLNYSQILKNMGVVGGGSSKNLEEYLRNERREFLLSVVKENRADFLALAHNANDQAETLVLNLVRGSGPAGLGAMKMSEEKIIRPLLNISRADIEGYARTNKLKWHEDLTNKDTRYNRNYIRHRLLPMLEQLNPEYLSTINRTAYLQQQIDEHFKEEAYRAMREPSSEKLRQLDKPLLYEVFGLMYEEAKGNRKNLSLSHLSAIAKMIEVRSGTKSLDLPGGVTARRVYDRLEFYVKKEHNVLSAPSTKKLCLGSQKFGKWVVTVNKVTATERDTAFSLTVDAEALKNLAIRTRRLGDVIAKKGLGAKKKLQDLFVDAKIDKAKRNCYPIISNKTSDDIIWVPGLAKSEYKPKNNTDLYQIILKEVNNETIEK
jgi:tRNA(Ile)-lysidine synthase